MSQYFRWINSKYKDDEYPPFPYVKQRRSNSLDPRSSEASGLKQFVVLQNNVGLLYRSYLVTVVHFDIIFTKFCILLNLDTNSLIKKKTDVRYLYRFLIKMFQNCVRNKNVCRIRSEGVSKLLNTPL